MFMVKKTPTIPDPPIFQEKTPVLHGTKFLKRGNPSRQWLLFSSLLIVGIIMLTLNKSHCLEGLPLRSEEHTSELQSRLHLVCRLLLEKKKHIRRQRRITPVS